ncbi:hypothetical protein HOT82_gp091 [Gordonia phage Ronaldo]|uniref:Uncharacterized protein n=3 Tax=Ronaldovirus TaxID=2733205 RepID=A0A6B9L8A5_9CAUD|nr:hypothetical protein HOT81_gp087 [Gordonia phage Fryberger]YP_009807787.1 hypothetical protein HOT82_gp091 [Gordonia phage Ronaldo]AXN53504.1 hypothetical protein SEA_FRYBERGER_87 [Gordonia phage Fryberger]AXN53653.1 hypothetical protein SEA_RONALDO_91 [Gordonia phage Ronaldo]QHB38207.1 hypothetical protein SEA_VOLT_91 [Gordonia phage Volt]
MTNTDPLSVPGIAVGQQELEGKLQLIPEALRKSSEDYARKLADYKKSYSLALAAVPYFNKEDRRYTNDERKEMAYLEVEEKWLDAELAKVEMNYYKSVEEILSSVLNSHQSRMKAALKVEEAHERYGQG